MSRDPSWLTMKSGDFSREFIFAASRSSGPGGQHVNKVSSRVELRFNIPGSDLLEEEEKAVVLRKLAGRINKEGFLRLSSQAERSQNENKVRVINRFFKLLAWALTPEKNRKSTAPTSASRIKRLETKHIHSEKKARRKPAVHDE